MKTILRFFLSLRTTFGLFALFAVTACAGSLGLTGNLVFFSGIDETPLFLWLSRSDSTSLTWWIYLMIIVLAVLAVNTIVCTIDGILKKRGRENFIFSISPHIMHIGVLFVMLGHMLTAALGHKADMTIEKGMERQVAEGITLGLNGIDVITDQEGYVTDWTLNISWGLPDGTKGKGMVRPVRPLYAGGYLIYTKSVETGEKDSALIRICMDPGAPWALAGALVLCAGGVLLAAGRALRKA